MCWSGGRGGVHWLVGTQVSVDYSRQALTREHIHRLSQAYMRGLSSFHCETVGGEYYASSDDEPSASTKLGPFSDASSPHQPQHRPSPEVSPSDAEEATLDVNARALGDRNGLKQRVVKPAMVIVGNKSDLRADQRQVPTEDGRKLAEQFNCSFTEARASVFTSSNSKTSTLTAGVLITGWDFVTEGLCRAATVLCPVFYVGDKVILYLFLTVHQASAYSARRNYTACSRPCAAQYVSTPSRVRVVAARAENWTNPTTRHGEKAAASEHRRSVC